MKLLAQTQRGSATVTFETSETIEDLRLQLQLN